MRVIRACKFTLASYRAAHCSGVMRGTRNWHLWSRFLNCTAPPLPPSAGLCALFRRLRLVYVVAPCAATPYDLISKFLIFLGISSIVATKFQDKAETYRSRSLARPLTNEPTLRMLQALIDEYTSKADELERPDAPGFD